MGTTEVTDRTMEEEKSKTHAKTLSSPGSQRGEEVATQIGGREQDGSVR